MARVRGAEAAAHLQKPLEALSSRPRSRVAAGGGSPDANTRCRPLSRAAAAGSRSLRMRAELSIVRYTHEQCARLMTHARALIASLQGSLRYFSPAKPMSRRQAGRPGLDCTTLKIARNGGANRLKQMRCGERRAGGTRPLIVDPMESLHRRSPLALIQACDQLAGSRLCRLQLPRRQLEKVCAKADLPKRLCTAGDEGLRRVRSRGVHPNPHIAMPPPRGSSRGCSCALRTGPDKIWSTLGSGKSYLALEATTRKILLPRRHKSA